MNQFITLFRYECKKIYSQKAFWFALLFMLLVSFANEMTPVLLGNYEKTIKTQKSLSGTVIDDAYLKEIQNKKSKKCVDPLKFFLSASTGRTSFKNLTEKKLYHTRKKICEGLMSEAKLSEKEKNYWRANDTKNKTPFTFTYDLAYADYMEMAGYMNFMVLIVCAIGLAGIFADEKHKGTDQLIFCTKKGKTTLFYAKLLAGTLMGFFTSLVIVMANAIICLAFNGTEGFHTPLQIHIPTCMMHITMGEACIYMSLLLLLSGTFMGIITMLLSQLTMNHPVTMGGMFFFLFASMFNLPSGLGWLATLWSMLPGTFVGSWLFEEYHIILFKDKALTLMQYTPLVWFVAIGLCVIISFVSYKKYEVKAR